MATKKPKIKVKFTEKETPFKTAAELDDAIGAKRPRMQAVKKRNTKRTS